MFKTIILSVVAVLSIFTASIASANEVDYNKAYRVVHNVSGEILAWIYHLVGGVPDDVTEVPVKYETVQIYAVIAGWTHAGAEGQTLSIENGVHRDFKFSDMLDYIHNNVLPLVRVGAIT